jgi:rhamnosyltransferase
MSSAETRRLGFRLNAVYLVTTKIAGIVVLFRPPAEVGARLRRLEQSGLPIIAVYNECDPERLEQLRSECGARFVTFAENRGLAAALNTGIVEAKRLGHEYVVLFDQDSEPAPGHAPALLKVLEEAQRAGCRVAAIGPTPVDVKGAPAPSLSAIRRFERVPTIITSGSLLPMAAIDAVGLMWEELFIDDIDHEWCMRAQWLGWDILRTRSVEMKHDLGDSGIAVLGHFKTMHRSPVRHYHIVRNTLVLLRMRGVDLRWRIVEGLKTLYRVPIYILGSVDRLKSAAAVVRAVRDHGKLLRTMPKEWQR